MTVRLHHLNCGSLCPACQRGINGNGGWTAAALMPCHCLLIETPEALVLVDTGFGTADVAHAHQRLGRAFTLLGQPKCDPAETALAQVQALGFDPRDVKHLVTTHLDLDHTGGLPDFPHAQVHVWARELEMAQHGGFMDRIRLCKHHIAHGPQWVTHRAEGDEWFGFEAVRIIPGLSAEIALIPLHGHTLGHCGVAVKVEGRWLLHAGDAYFNRATLDGSAMPPLIGLFEKMVQRDARQRLHNQARLRSLIEQHGDEVDVFCAHDLAEFQAHAA